MYHSGVWELGVMVGNGKLELFGVPVDCSH